MRRPYRAFKVLQGAHRRWPHFCVVRIRREEFADCLRLANGKPLPRAAIPDPAHGKSRFI